MFGLHFSFSNTTKYENGYLDMNKQITPKFFQISALLKYIFDFLKSSMKAAIHTKLPQFAILVNHNKSLNNIEVKGAKSLKNQNPEAKSARKLAKISNFFLTARNLHCFLR